MLAFLSRSTAVVCNCCPLRHLASGAHPVFCPVMTKTELPGTPPPHPLAPAARGNETLPVSVRPQDPRQEHLHPALTILLQGLRLGCTAISPGPEERGWRTQLPPPLLRCSLDLGSGSGSVQLEGDLTPALPPGAGRSWWEVDTEQRALGRMGQGEELQNSLSITNCIASASLKHFWEGWNPPPKPRQWRGSLALLPLPLPASCGQAL